MTELRTRLDPQRHADLRRVLVTPDPEPGTVVRKSLIAAAVLATVVVAVAVRPDPVPENNAPWTAVPQAAPR
ncbi:hypothetical protein M1L60_38850 [Actinoplanes sp. TRM 88003]|uniref:Uncharacterized protein n=1 Tax=Paractinoplanes aksuensis TaxID=2939490 RepID=A0ABT1E096_9ACTN|nr:hypothetical protein [Actinoplanes aksuensis]MCO8276554.1 hypothetical protein [Actinoplanes aksuensis]